jgi:threonine/homoserine/homoserine lactone efflux protein
VQSLFLGLGIGLAAGISPGPLLVLVISSSLRGGLRHGAAVAVAPLFSDLVVVGVVLAALGRIPDTALTTLGVIGGVVVAAVGVQTIRDGQHATLAVEPGVVPTGAGADFGRGALVNLLSPHPWISWITILGPLTLAHARASLPGGVLLVVGFYVTLVGSKVAVAALVAGGRRRLTDAGYRAALVVAGVALVAIGAGMVVEFVRLSLSVSS